MRILALQLKRIGDLVLTTPALRALRTAWPDAEIALAVAPGCAALLGAISPITTGVVLGRGRGFAPWQQVLTGPWDVCLDFTGTDRSALATGFSRAKKRVAFEWVKKRRLRAVAYNRFVDSSVRERHTIDHYLDLAGAAGSGAGSPPPELRVPEAARLAAAEILHTHGVKGPFAVLHPGTARPEKYWRAGRWAEVAAHLRDQCGLPCVLTGGGDPLERAHADSIQAGAGAGIVNLGGRLGLLTFAALLAQARLCVSCDTGAVHLAAAFRTPQIALFGPTNPFHWRPRHERALVLSAAQPDAVLTDFQPRMKGAPMDRISTELVIGAIAQLIPTP